MAKYNISKFNIKNQGNEDDYLISMNCTESMDLMYSLGLNSKLTMQGSESLNTINQITGGLPINLDLSEIISAKTQILAHDVLSFLSQEAIMTNTNVAKNISFERDFTENIKMNFIYAIDVEFHCDGEENLYSSMIFMGKDTLFRAEISEEVIVNTSATILDHYLSKLNVTLQPGESIVIDYDRFTIYKGEENMLDEFMGHWFELSRKTASIDLSATGEISGKLYYKERYL